jgi:insulysin
VKDEKKKKETIERRLMIRLSLPFELSLKSKQLQRTKIQKILLNNGIQTLLISDKSYLLQNNKSTPFSAAALTVNAGSWLDNKHDGTAHFLEHMLFLGTKKFPNENDYEKFIYDNGGHMNGYTSRYINESQPTFVSEAIFSSSSFLNRKAIVSQATFVSKAIFVCH